MSYRHCLTGVNSKPRSLSFWFENLYGFARGFTSSEHLRTSRKTLPILVCSSSTPRLFPNSTYPRCFQHLTRMLFLSLDVQEPLSNEASEQEQDDINQWNSRKSHNNNNFYVEGVGEDPTLTSTVVLVKMLRLHTFPCLTLIYQNYEKKRNCLTYGFLEFVFNKYLIIDGKFFSLFIYLWANL